ncbi:MAG: radical SAM protein [Deltaproteobacteria bacterium]|nr:MAG: radical SAM protein [Deltaproteobacteria bacterium]
MSKKVNRHFIIPIFIPHQGCPYRCIFCQQATITNVSEDPLTVDHIRNTIDLAIKSKHFPDQRPKEIAFYGGTFTSLPTASMKKMLSAVRPFIEKGIIQSIRISTRPDSLSEAKLDILRSFGVSTVELGVQSMNDKVLLLSNRGHTSRDTINAVKLLKKRGFNVGIQLMPGLPGDDKGVFMDTIEKVIGLRPDMARLYPTLVIRGTILAKWYREGKYTPMGLNHTVDLCKEACIRLEGSGVPVIRIGLMSSPSLLKRGEIVAGPWHPSLGFLVQSAIHLERLRPYLPTPGGPKNIILLAPKEEIPLIRGHKKGGIRHIETITGTMIKDIIPDDSIPSGRISIQSL